MNKRFFSKSLITFLLISWATISHAQNVVLACVNPTDNFTLDVVLKEKAERVVISGMEVPAVYTKTTISFDHEVNGVNYFALINRGSGVLMVQNTKTGVVLTPYMCSVASKKF